MFNTLLSMLKKVNEKQNFLNLHLIFLMLHFKSVTLHLGDRLIITLLQL